jgi:hypothetical protein
MPRIPFLFPEKGKNDNVNYSAQPPDTSSDLSNVRVFDTLLGRRRGGSRPGLAKWHPNTINGSARLQYLLKAVEAVAQGTNDVPATLSLGHAPTDTGTYDYSTINLDTEAFLRQDDVTTDNFIVRAPTGEYYVSGNRDGSDKTWRWPATGAALWGNTSYGGQRVCYDSTNEMVGVNGPTAQELHGLQKSDGVRQWTFDAGYQLEALKSRDDGHFYLVCRENSSYTGAGATKSVFKIKSDDGSIVQSFKIGVQGFSQIDMCLGPNGQVIVTTSKSTQDWDGQTTEAAANVWVLDEDLAYVNSTELTQNIWVSGGNIQRHCACSNSGDIFIVDVDGYGTRLSITDLSEKWAYRLSDAGGGNIVDVEVDRDNKRLWISGELQQGWRELNGTYQLVNYRLSGRVPTGFDMGISSGSTRHLHYLKNQQTLATRTTSLIAVAGGDIVRIEGGTPQTLTNAEDALVTTQYAVQAAEAFSVVYFVDGTNNKKLTLSTGVVASWAPGDSFPATPPRLICRWRGRIVVAGMIADPHNWFMSRVGDPEDFDTAPATTDAIMAVGGSIGEYGVAGDIITALAPFDDDVLIIGMDSSIGRMAGDPAAGGVIDVVTEKTGMAWDAWAMGPDNTLYFMGNDGIYSMGRDSVPVNITEGVLDGAFQNVDLSSKRVILEYDWENRGLVVVIADVDSATANTAFFMENRTGGWFPVSWPTAMGPDVLLGYDGENSDDRTLLLGCRDGYIRQPDDDQTDDDGTTLTSNVRMFPVGTRRGTDSRLLGLEVNLAESSGDVTLKLYTGQTAEQCATSTEVRWSRVLKAGKNNLTLPRLRGAWLQIEFASTTRWAIESVFGLFEEGGRARRTKR